MQGVIRIIWWLKVDVLRNRDEEVRGSIPTLNKN
jgi:hypothetical protein